MLRGHQRGEQLASSGCEILLSVERLIGTRHDGACLVYSPGACIVERSNAAAEVELQRVLRGIRALRVNIVGHAQDVKKKLGHVFAFSLEEKTRAELVADADTSTQTQASQAKPAPSGHSHESVTITCIPEMEELAKLD